MEEAKNIAAYCMERGNMPQALGNEDSFERYSIEHQSAFGIILTPMLGYSNTRNGIDKHT